MAALPVCAPWPDFARLWDRYEVTRRTAPQTPDYDAMILLDMTAPHPAAESAAEAQH